MGANSNKNKTARFGVGSKPAKKKKKPFKLTVSRIHKPEDLPLEEWQRTLRKEYGILQKFILKNVGDHPIFSDFRLTNPASGKTYNLIIRGNRPGENYCSCPDFAVNNLGTCKHLEFTLSRLEKKRGARKVLAAGYHPPYSEIYLQHGIYRPPPSGPALSLCSPASGPG